MKANALLGARTRVEAGGAEAGGARAEVQVTEINQSINQRSSQSHTRAKEKPHPSTTTGGANPASQSDAGLGGYEREK